LIGAQRVAGRRLAHQCQRRLPHAAAGVDAIAYRDDRVEVVVLEVALHLPSALDANCQEFLSGCRLLQLAVRIDVLQVHQHVLGRRLEQLRHLPLGQPDLVAVELDLHPDAAVGRFVDADLTAGTVGTHARVSGTAPLERPARRRTW